MPSSVDPRVLFDRLYEDPRIRLPLNILKQELMDKPSVPREYIATLFREGGIFYIDLTRAAAEHGAESWQAVPEYGRSWNRLLDALLVQRLSRHSLSGVIVMLLQEVPESPGLEVMEYYRLHLIDVLRHVIWTDDWR